MRVIVTGSRDWEDADLIRRELDALVDPLEPLVIMHGDCPTGADAVADEWARRNAFINDRWPADWQTYGRKAGPMRNAAMVAHGADLVLAFIRNASKGATHTADLAEKAGIPVRRYTA